MDRHAQGILLITLSAVAYSSAGFFTRLIHLDAWTMLFWRGLFAGLMILCVIVVQERRNTVAAIQAIGRPGCDSALEKGPRFGVRPCGWTESSCRFDRPPGVLILELRWAEVA
jgi:hypothetical protein